MYSKDLYTLKETIWQFTANDNHYKFWMYLDMNNNLVPSKYIKDCRTIVVRWQNFHWVLLYYPSKQVDVVTPLEERFVKRSKFSVMKDFFLLYTNALK